jgi:hypothetical protein
MGGRTCAQIAADYQDAIPAAQSCNTAAATACAMTMPDKLGCNPCEIPVQEDAKLLSLQKEWTSQGCNKQICPLIAIRCVYPVNRVGACQSDIVTTVPNPNAAEAAAKVKGSCVWQAGGLIPITN